MKLKKIAVTATMAAALGLGALGATGAAQADDDWCLPWVPCDFGPGPGPGVLPPPGHIGQITGIPPGHWWVNPGWVNHL
jgi:hypothetical protein